MFNQEYYETIWPDQGVHRHDYCEDLSNRLIQQYGKAKILDIGTGCGYLVKLLREKGCDAWGLEISDYAIANSCAVGYMRKGDIRDIPFASGFNVVHSQGVWGYFPKEDIQKAWKECKRVGKIQHHTIDYSDIIPEHKYLFSESEEWWKNQFYPKILIACPNNEVKEYAFKDWIDNVNQFTYPNFDILVVDNTTKLDFMNRWKDKVPMFHISVEENASIGFRITESMEIIRKKFLEDNYTYYLNLESDVIPPKNIIEYMLLYGKDADWISHGYPGRGNQGYMQGIGCSLFNRKIMEENDFIHGNRQNGGDGLFWEKIEKQGLKYKTTELYFHLDVKHLGTGIGSQ